MTASRIRRQCCFLVIVLFTTAAWPWGNEGHSAINRVAAENLPADVPGFLRNAADQLAFLSSEPDRWRESSELALKLSQEPDHFIDLERVEGMTLPADRYSFYRALEARRERTNDRSNELLPEKVGLQPYITMEVYGRLVVAFRQYRQALAGHRSPEFAERDAIFYAGWLGHYVGDGSNPMHTTVHHNGWIGPNPNGYTTSDTVHWKMEGIFVAANPSVLQFASLISPLPRRLNDPFQDYLSYLRQSHTLVEKTYQLEKDGGFDGAGKPASREFIKQRLAAGAEMLRDLWYTAWLDSAQQPISTTTPKPATTPAPANPPPPRMRTAPKLGDTAPPLPGN